MVPGRSNHICHWRDRKGAERQGGMIWRALVAIAGLAVVVAATHVNVVHRGGYGAIDSWLVIAVSALLAVGMGYVAIEMRHGSRFGAILLALCLLAGEAYWL